ncbi:MAG: YebC/PmpR family DNA-binding regulatory protein [Glaciecola sp.]
MAGHSKWANTKHRKGRQDEKRAKEFAKLIRSIEVAAKSSGDSDPESSPALSLAVTKAKQSSVPKDTIERACKRGAGELGDAADYQEIQYEGYAASGVAVLVDCLTDNRNRTSSDVRNAFTKLGGNLADPNSVSYMFHRRGQVVIAAGATEDAIMVAGLEAGLEDIEAAGDTFIAWCEPTDAIALSKAFEQAGLEVLDTGSTLVSELNIPITELADAKKILRLIDALEDNDDVQEVYANYDIDDDLLEQAMDQD